MSTWDNLRPCSPLKIVFNKLGDTYQAYCNTYKTHAMATHHGGAGQPLYKDTAQHGQDADIPDNCHHEDMDNFENAGQENNTNLANLTQELDDLCYRIQAREGQLTEALNCIEHKFQRLSIALCWSAPPEPLDDVLRQYTDTLCPAQRQTNFTNTLL